MALFKTYPDPVDPLAPPFIDRVSILSRAVQKPWERAPNSAFEDREIYNMAKTPRFLGSNYSKTVPIGGQKELVQPPKKKVNLARELALSESDGDTSSCSSSDDDASLLSAFGERGVFMDHIRTAAGGEKILILLSSSEVFFKCVWKKEVILIV